MARDYAKRYQQKSRHNPDSTSFGLWLFTLLLIGAFIAGLYYARHHRHVARAHKTRVPALVKTTPVSPTTSSDDVMYSPKYDFYTILPKTQVTAKAPVLKGHTASPM